MRKTITGFLTILLAGCSQQAINTSNKPDENLPQEYRQLSWVLTADVKKELSSAISKRDFRLLTVSGRGAMLPGIPSDERTEAKRICGIKYMKGVGDVILNEQHKILRQKAIDYAKAYNAKIIENCRKTQIVP